LEELSEQFKLALSKGSKQVMNEMNMGIDRHQKISDRTVRRIAWNTAYIQDVRFLKLPGPLNR